MSETGDALISAITQTFHTIKHMERIEPAVAHAICEHLGITWGMVDYLDHVTKSGLTWEIDPNGGPNFPGAIRDRLATLLEAAGIGRN